MVIEIFEIVNPNTELPVLLSIFSLDLESQAQIDIVKKKTQSNADEKLSSFDVKFYPSRHSTDYLSSFD